MPELPAVDSDIEFKMELILMGNAET